MADASAFPAWLKQRRSTLDLTQVELAQRVGCSVDAIYHFERGTRRPSKQIVDRLAAALEIPLEARASFLRLARSKPAVNNLVAVPDAAVIAPRLLTNLPEPPTPLIGREREVATVRTELLRDEVRLLTLVGPAGAGKTRLALDVAARLVDDFEDGVCFVALATVEEPAQVKRAIAQALGIRESAEQAGHDHVHAYLRTRRLLLVLDNFEQVIAAAPVVAELLVDCASIKVLVTSRERLRVRAEWVFDLDGLSYPTSVSGDLEGYGAVELLTHCIRQTQRDWAFTGAEREAAVRICRLVEGLPLAIELAAATVRESSCVAIAAALEAGRQTFTAPRDLPERHQSIWAALEHSWRLMTHVEHNVFPRLAVFRGGFDAAPASMIAGVSQDTLEALINRSLLRRSVDIEGVPRYHLHELVRQYAHEKLRATGAAGLSRDQHLRYYLALAEAAETHLSGPAQSTWLRSLEREHANLTTALQWALDTAQIEQALRLVTALKHFWYIHGDWSEGRTWLRRVLALADADPALLTHAVGNVSALWGRALLGAADLATCQGDYAEATIVYEQALALFRTQGDDSHAGMALQGLARLALEIHDYARARTLYQASIPLLQGSGDRMQLATTLHGLGNILLVEGELTQAATLFEEGLRHFRDIGDRGAIAASLTYAAGVAYRQKDLVRARALCSEAITLCRELQHKLGLSWALRYLGGIAQDEGHYQEATRHFGESLQLRWELQELQGAAWALEGLAEVAAAQGRAAHAALIWGQAEAIRERTAAPLPPDERAAQERHIASARAWIAPEQFIAAWTIGHQMTPEAAIAHILTD